MEGGREWGGGRGRGGQIEREGEGEREGGRERGSFAMVFGVEGIGGYPSAAASSSSSKTGEASPGPKKAGPRQSLEPKTDIWTGQDKQLNRRRQSTGPDKTVN